MQLPDEAAAAEQVRHVDALAVAAAKAQEERRLSELEARKKEAAERAAAAKRERDATRAAMARDRAEVKARGPAQASVAQKLPSGAVGVNRLSLDDDDERPGQPGQ